MSDFFKILRFITSLIVIYLILSSWAQGEHFLAHNEAPQYSYTAVVFGDQKIVSQIIKSKVSNTLYFEKKDGAIEYVAEHMQNGSLMMYCPEEKIELNDTDLKTIKSQIKSCTSGYIAIRTSKQP